MKDFRGERNIVPSLSFHSYQTMLLLMILILVKSNVVVIYVTN